MKFNVGDEVRISKVEPITQVNVRNQTWISETNARVFKKLGSTGTITDTGITEGVADGVNMAKVVFNNDPKDFYFFFESELSNVPRM